MENHEITIDYRAAKDRALKLERNNEHVFMPNGVMSCLRWNDRYFVLFPDKINKPSIRIPIEGQMRFGREVFPGGTVIG